MKMRTSGRTAARNPAARRLAPLIEHTLLRADARAADIRRLCREARRCGFGAVCVLPCRVSLAVKALAGSGIRTVTVIGFPLGGATLAVKAREATAAVRAGAVELDMVLALGALKDGDRGYVRREIAAVVRAARGRPVKVILETALLTGAEKRVAARLALAAGASFVKTSTGLAGGATVADVRLLRRTVGRRLGIKASGGIRTRRQALALLRAGATRLGTSAGPAIVEAETRCAHS